MTLIELITNSFKDPDIKNSKYVELKDLKRTGNIIKGTTITYAPDSKPSKHFQELTTLDALPFTSSKKVVVSCNCERFKFFYEVVLKRKGASIIKYSNGELPKQTNPTYVAGVCKHLVTILKFLKTKKY